MMLLSDISTKGYDSFENAGYRVPKYNRKKMVTKTMESPFWIQKIFQLFPDCRKFSEAIPYKLQALPLQRKVISFVSRMVLIAKT